MAILLEEDSFYSINTEVTSESDTSQQFTRLVMNPYLENTPYTEVHSYLLVQRMNANIPGFNIYLNHEQRPSKK